MRCLFTLALRLRYVQRLKIPINTTAAFIEVSETRRTAKAIVNSRDAGATLMITL